MSNPLPRFENPKFSVETSATPAPSPAEVKQLREQVNQLCQERDWLFRAMEQQAAPAYVELFKQYKWMREALEQNLHMGKEALAMAKELKTRNIALGTQVDNYKASTRALQARVYKLQTRVDKLKARRDKRRAKRLAKKKAKKAAKRAQKLAAEVAAQAPKEPKRKPKVKKPKEPKMEPKEPKVKKKRSGKPTRRSQKYRRYSSSSSDSSSCDCPAPPTRPSPPWWRTAPRPPPVYFSESEQSSVYDNEPEEQASDAYGEEYGEEYAEASEVPEASEYGYGYGYEQW